jgi:hypothetical protein
VSDESLAATPGRKERREIDVEGKKEHLYSRTLAKSLAKKRGVLRKVALGAEDERREESETVVDEEELEKCVFCGDEEGVDKEDDALRRDEENVREVEVQEEDDEDDEPVVASRQRRLKPRARKVVSDTEEEESEEEEALPVTRGQRKVSPQEDAIAMPPPLTSTKPPHRKGHSTISNWAQEVIDLTSSPEPPESFVLPPLTRGPTASVAASSRPTSSASNDVDAMLHL